MARYVPRGATPMAKSLLDEINALRADLSALSTLFSTHVHSGITVGAANSGAPTVAPAALTSLGVSDS